MIWNKWLSRPFKLKLVIDEGQGTPIVLLHGIGKTGGVWKHLITDLKHYSTLRILAYDLLGFGDSPKPDWIKYDVDDHADAVIYSLDKVKGQTKFIIVGHSMGCLIALHVASKRPDLVKHLILYEMPLYDGLPEKRIYRLRLKAYEKFYNWIIDYKPEFDPSNIKRAHKLAQRVVGFEVNQNTWIPFIKSLENTIMHQTANTDIKDLVVPMDVIYGTFDMFVIRGQPSKYIGSPSQQINTFNVRARHIISVKASHFLTKRILGAIALEYT